MRKVRAASSLIYPKFNSGFNMFIGYAGQTDSGAFNMNNSFFGGAGSDNMFRAAGVDGNRIFVRWNRIETSQGVYDFSGVDNAINGLAAIGKRTGITLLAPSFQETNSHLPLYIINDPATYGGSAGHGGEVPPANGVNGWKVRWWNANVQARFSALMTAMVAHFGSNPNLAYFHVDEFLTDITTANIRLASTELGGADTESAGADSIAAAQRIIHSIAHQAWSTTPIPFFGHHNYLSGDNGGFRVLANIQWAYDNGLNFAAELALPTPYNRKYPFQTSNPSDTITYSSITANIQLAMSLGFNKMFLTTDVLGSTWSTYSEFEAANMMRYAAEVLKNTSESYYGIVIENGVNGFSGLDREKRQWQNIGSLFKDRYLRT